MKVDRIPRVVPLKDLFMKLITSTFADFDLPPGSLTILASASGQQREATSSYLIHPTETHLHEHTEHHFLTGIVADFHPVTLDESVVGDSITNMILLIILLSAVLAARARKKTRKGRIDGVHHSKFQDSGLDLLPSPETN